MIRSFGKLMQLAGLVILPVAMLVQVTSEMRASSISVMLMMMVFGAAIFTLGRIVEGYAGP